MQKFQLLYIQFFFFFFRKLNLTKCLLNFKHLLFIVY
ncbi:unnamed protein product [Brugia timori]|uniref:Uncharacterized protein n=1 Tax=Brugia timori TaxID=42155 RepID=A0A0R3RDK7_9BILA|nr:unnamed protein product [Brugia timori]